MGATKEGILFIAVLVFTAMTGCIVFTPITTIPLLFWVKILNRSDGIIFRVLHQWNNLIQGSWFYLVSWMLQVVLGVQLDASLIDSQGKTLKEFLTQPAKAGKCNLLILNHRTRIDWMLMWILLAQTDMLFTLKIVLKGELSNIPFFGWTMQTFRFLFLTRKWETDKIHLAKVFSYMHRHKETATYLIFPEGSDLSPTNIAKSTEYAAKNGLPVFQHVLNPRVTGLLAMKNLIGVENIDRVFDITMGFSDHPKGGRPNEKSLIDGKMAGRIHFLIASHTVGKSAGEIPSDDEGFKRWIEKSFENKELLLSNFYRSSPTQFDENNVRQILGTSHTVSTFRSLHTPQWSGVLVIFMWLIPTAYVWLWTLLVQWSCSLLLWSIAVSAFYVVVGRKFGGVDKWLMYP